MNGQVNQERLNTYDTATQSQLKGNFVTRQPVTLYKTISYIRF
jgi:hypothetical protein